MAPLVSSGLIIGPFAGAVLGKLTAHRDLGRAGRAGIAAWIGFLIGTVVKVGLAFAMVGIFLTAWFLVLTPRGAGQTKQSRSEAEP